MAAMPSGSQPSLSDQALLSVWSRVNQKFKTEKFDEAPSRDNRSSSKCDALKMSRRYRYRRLDNRSQQAARSDSRG